MARNSTSRDLLKLIALLPWWVCLALAAASYFLFTALAGQPVTGSGGAARVNLVAVFSGALRFVAPTFLVLAALMSAIGRAQRKRLLASAQAGGPGSVASMRWQEFELLVGEAFRAQGYSVAELGGAGADGGVDLVLKRGAEKALVQCKHWKAFRVGVPVAREMLGAMTAAGATKGWVITSGRFTAEAEQFARQHRITLVDGNRLPAFLGKGRQQVGPRQEPPLMPLAGPERPPACQLCSKPMVERIARKGAQAGGRFWGCSTYPACRGTRPMDGPTTARGA